MGFSSKPMAKGVATLVVFAVVCVVGYVGWRGYAEGWFAEKANAEQPGARKKAPAAELLKFDNGDFGMKLSDDALQSMELQPVAVERAVKDRALPPQVGTINYDNERLFPIRPRFAGELVEVMQIPDAEYPQGQKKLRPIRFGDPVKQGDVLAVLWSRDLGEKKAALVDAMCALALSKTMMKKQEEAVRQGGLPAVTLLQTERQVQADTGAVVTAERTLRMWKLPNSEIQEVKDEAKQIIDLKKILQRDPELEKKWARVELRAPKFSDDPKKELTIVEKNTSLADMVDPSRDTPLLRLADLSRLQIWVHPPEEYMPFLRKRLNAGPGGLKWQIRFQADAGRGEPLMLDVAMVSPMIVAQQYTPMLIGYLDNPDRRYLIGQALTATIFMPPPEDTVEVKTDALNPVGGQTFVFIEKPNSNNEFIMRRVSVAQTFKDISYVRIRPTAEEELQNPIDEKNGKYPIRGLQPGDRVVTRGAVEMTAALDELRSAKKK